EALLALSSASTFCLSFFTKGCPSSVTSLRNFCTLPSTIFATISAGLPDSAALAAAMLRSFSTRSAGTSSRDNPLGLDAAMCMARSRASCSSPPTTSTSTPIFAPPWTYCARRPFASILAKRLIERFSPILPISAVRVCSTVAPPRGSAERAATSAGFRPTTSSASDLAKFRKSAFFATKSVSQFTSTIAPVRLSPFTLIATTPSAAVRLDAFDALLPRRTRSSSSAFARSPFASTSAFLHSIMGASVLSRSSLTAPAVISAISTASSREQIKKKGLPSPLSRLGSNRSFFLPARLVDLDELVRGRADDLLHDLAAPPQDRVGDAARVQADRAAGIIVARDHVRDPVGRVVGVDHADHGDAELLRLGDRALLVADVDDEQRVGPVVQALDAAQAALQLRELAL